MFNVVILTSLLTETANNLANGKPQPGVFWDEDGVAAGVKDVRALIISLVEASDRVNQKIVWNQAIDAARNMRDNQYENAYNQMRFSFYSGIILAVEDVLGYGGVIEAVSPSKYHACHQLGYLFPETKVDGKWGNLPALIGGDADGDVFKADGILSEEQLGMMENDLNPDFEHGTLDDAWIGDHDSLWGDDK